MNSFQLAPAIANSCVEIGDLALSKVLLKNNALLPWCILVPKVSNISEIYQLHQLQRHQLSDEIAVVSEVMQSHFKPLKINVGALGNIVSQLHIHVVARFETDAYWPHGIWQANMPEKPYHPDTLQELVQQLKMKLAID